MKIRKKFKIEMGHLVRNCSTEKCARNQHGHSAAIEVILRSDCPDNGGMVYDFGLLKSNVKALIDAFDHSYVYWEKDDPEFIRYIKKFNSRYIEATFNPTAENLAMYFHQAIQKILDNTEKKNSESWIEVESVIYHETETGYAQTEESDFSNDSGWWTMTEYECKFSKAIYDEFPEGLKTGNMTNPDPIRNNTAEPTTEQLEIPFEEPGRECKCHTKKTSLKDFLDETDRIRSNMPENNQNPEKKQETRELAPEEKAATVGFLGDFLNWLGTMADGLNIEDED